MKRFFKDDWNDDSSALKFNTKMSKNKGKEKEKHLNKTAIQAEKNASELTEKLKQNTATLPKLTKSMKKQNKKNKLNKTKNNPIVKAKTTIIAINKQNLIKNATTNIIRNIDTTTEFSNKLRDNLKGGRFRFLNQQLYTIKGSEAKDLFDDDTDAFASYHEGYKQQVSKWPLNPLDRIIKKLKKLPKHLVIGDFGCGEAKLSESIQNKVFSMDLVSVRPDVIACDMANTPLNSDSIDVAVYCLSLMGTNLNEFLLEANRLVKNGGYLFIAEIASRFENIKQFINLVERFGFKMERKDQDAKQYFIFFDFKKINSVDKSLLNGAELQLKPCLYKKR